MTSGADLRPPAAVLALSDGERCTVQVVARPAGERDGVDAVTELAVLAAASRLPRLRLLVPARLRDVRDDAVVAAPVVVTTAERLLDGRVELDVVALPPADAGHVPAVGAMSLEPALSPVASLLHEALTTSEVDLPVGDVAAVLAGWGHGVSARPTLLPPDRARIDHTRHRVHRLAAEWSARHRPMAPAGQDRRPGAPVNLPVGFVPACPL